MIKKKSNHYEKDDNVYLNVNIPHNDSLSVNGSPTIANFFQIRNEKLFDLPPKMYSMSVVRFTIPTGYIPLTIMPVTINPSNVNDPNYSIYSVTLSYNGYDSTTNLIYKPQNTYIDIPPAPLPGDNPIRFKYIDYYSIYSVQWMLDMINEALNTSFNDIKANFPLASPTKPPFLTFNPSNKLFSINAQIEYDSNQPPPYIQIYFNHYLDELFESSFCNIYNSYATNTKNTQYLIQNLITNVSTILSYPPGHQQIYTMNQEYCTLSQWYPLSSIVFTTGSLPIRSEWVSIGNSISQNISGSTNNISNNNFLRILTDFEIDPTFIFETRSFIHYVPTAEYRRIDLLGNTSISTIDIQIWWKDNYQNLYPILIPAHYNVSIKILFELKKSSI